MSPSRYPAVVFFCALCLAGTVVSCKSAGSSSPTAAAAGSLSAQEEIRDLEEAWELQGAYSRRKLRPRLEAFLLRYPFDPSGTRVRLMLAQIALLEHRLKAAEQLLGPVIKGPGGSAKDEASVIQAAVECEQGKFDQALARLEPLRGKLLTPEARDQFSRVRTRAALSAKRFRLALDAMTVWLVEAGPAAAPVKEWIAVALTEIPSRALAQLLSDWPSQSGSSAEDQARDYLHRLFIEHLTSVALETKDHQLARDLLELSPPWLRASESGDALAVLAALAEREARVVGRSVGVVLGGQTALARKRSMRLGAGLMRRLGTLSEGEPSIKLLVSEDRGSVTSALGMLSGLGASVLIAGVTPESADEAVEFAAARGVPVIVVSPPAKVPLGNFGFVFGPDMSTEQEAMRGPPLDGREFEYVSEPLVCSPGVGAKAAFPVSTWVAAGVQAVGVLTEASCVRALIDQRRKAGVDFAIVAGLTSGNENFQEDNLYRLETGDFPQAGALTKSAELSAEERLLLEGEQTDAAKLTDWFATLGEDVGTLVHAALSSLPETEVIERNAVRERHLRTKSALETARGKLVSTEARGFSKDHTISRTFRVVKITGETRRP